MQIDLWWSNVQAMAAGWVQSWTYDELYKLWLASGAVLLVGLLRVSHRIMRKAFGHIQFRGMWYNEKEAEVLILMIDEDCKR